MLVVVGFEVVIVPFVDFVSAEVVICFLVEETFKEVGTFDVTVTFDGEVVDLKEILSVEELFLLVCKVVVVGDAAGSPKY